MINIVHNLEEAVNKCHLCTVVDKPYAKYEVYTHWLPSITEKLIITESPPPGIKENFFYNLNFNDRLRSILKKFLKLEKLNDLEFLNFLKERRIFLTNSIKCRPFSKRDLETLRSRCTYLLAREVKVIRPRIIIVMGVTALKSLSQVLGVNFTLGKDKYFKTHNFNNLEVITMPHPLHVWRFLHDKIDEVSNILRTFLLR